MNGLATSTVARAQTKAGRELSPFVWLIVILGGLPLFLPALLYLGEDGLAKTQPIYWYFWINALFSAPHVYSTYARLSRKIAEGRTSAAMGWPCYALIVAALGVAAHFGRALEAFTAINVWQSFHYVRQVYGVSRIYGRAEEETVLSRRLAFATYHLAMPLFVLGRWDTLYTVWAGHPSSTIIPVRFPNGVMVACWSLAAAGFGIGAGCEAIKIMRQRTARSATGLAILLVSFAVHAVGFLSVTYYQRGFFAVTIFHGVQYLGLMWAREARAASGIVALARRSLPALASFPAFWLGFLVAGFSFEKLLFADSAPMWTSAAGILLIGISAHHYAADTAIWRARAGS